ncbi:MAG: phenylacetate--CoA ligase family protein [Bacteroidales bacterium]|nr:phenylacetate--CoA ligase family protein [Bacteroidales bacterium]
MQTWSKEDVFNWQNEKLHDLIHYAYNNTKYYKMIFDENRINPNDIKNIEDLKIIPTLTKKNVIDNYNRLIAKDISQIPHIMSSTGGSTGNPMKFLLDKSSWSFSKAHNIINWERTEYKYGDKYIALGSTSLFVNKSKSLKHELYYKLKNKIGLNGINMSNDICENYIELIKKKKIRYIYGYASAIYLLAKYVSENNFNIDISACFPTSEILTDLYRDTIEKAFNCQIINCYGANDGGITAFEVEKGFFEVGYNSIINLKDKNNTGSALLTDLLNYAMPLINYQLGDELQIDVEKNKTYSYNGQVINKVFGRISDVLRLENGVVLTGPGFTILFKDLPVEAYSIEKNGYNSLLCNIKKQTHYEKEHENLIISTLKKQAGKEAKISIKYLDEFELTKSGKKRYFIAN